MKNIQVLCATFALILASVVPPAGAYANDEHPTDTVCIPPRGVLGCATGTISSRLGPCDAAGCHVTLSAQLSVTPIACGWMSWNDVSACAYTAPAADSGAEKVYLPPGAYKMISELCIADPTVSVTTPCEDLRHNFLVPAAGGGLQANLPIILATVFAMAPDGESGAPAVCEGELVYASATFRAYGAECQGRRI